MQAFCNSQPGWVYSAAMAEPKRIAIVHDWLTTMRGGEKVLEAICGLFPNADLYTLIHRKGSTSPTIEGMPIHTSFIQHLPFAGRIHRYYLPLFPAAMERFELADYDLVISSHHCVAKGVRTPPETLHICYCHTPMRYLWTLYDEYFGEGKAGFITRLGVQMFLGYLRRWDVRTAQCPKHFVANSGHVRRRIREIYHRESEVVHPPVDVGSFVPSHVNDRYYLVAGALVPYKRVDLAVEAFNRTGERLVIAGEGPDLIRLKRTAKQNIEFVGWQTDAQLRVLYSGCRVLVFPGEEDFGIVPLEAMASGKPVIAFGKGGALETVVDGVTGLLFANQSVDSLLDAIRRCSSRDFEPEVLRKHALKFDRSVFLERFGHLVHQWWEEFSSERQTSRHPR